MNQKNQRGITLIALVITIIVLLILTGVTINMVLGNDGIIAQAQQAKQAQETAEEDENTKIAEGEIAIHFTRKKQEGENENILFNNGYLTNVATVSYEGIELKTVDEILADLPEGYSIENLTSAENIKTGSIIKNKNKQKVGTVIIYGDVDGNGIINTRDVAYINRFLAKWEGYTEEDLEEYQILAMDVDNNKIINLNDYEYLIEVTANNNVIEQNRESIDRETLVIEYNLSATE